MKEGYSSRRKLLQGGLAGAAALAAMTVSDAHAQTTPKIAKSAVMYQDHPNGGNHCSICVNFLPPDACKLVAGKISPNGWCGAFAPKAA